MARADSTTTTSPDQIKQLHIERLKSDLHCADMLPFGMDVGKRKEEIRSQIRRLEGVA